MHKDFIVLYCFYTPFQITIVLSYRAAMFVLHVDTFKARAMFAPRSRAVKKPYGASLGRVQLLVNINRDHGCTLHAYRFLHNIETFNIFRSVQEKKGKHTDLSM